MHGCTLEIILNQRGIKAMVCDEKIPEVQDGAMMVLPVIMVMGWR